MSPSSPDNSFTVSSDFRLRDTAKKYKYSRWTQQEQQFSVDTAAIATAFPDFTQGSTSDDLTIDFGRAANPKGHLPKSQSLPAIQYNSINNTDMLRQRVLNKTSNNQRENMPPNSSPYVSNASRTTSGDRKQLAELRAQVQSDTENSTMGTERTTTVTFPPSKTRASRFAQNKVNKSHKSDRTESQQIPANISARFTSPAKSVNRTPGQATQSSFIIQNGDMTARDTEELELPVIVEHGAVQQRKSSARRFQRVGGIRTPEEEKELWLLSEKLKAENAALKSRAEYQQHVNNSLQEQNARILREVNEFKTRMASEFEVKITEMSRKVDTVVSENTVMKAESAAIRAKNAALSNEKEVEAHDLSRLEAELARLRADFQGATTQEINTTTRTASPKKVQKSSTHTFRSESRVEFEGTNTDMQFEIPNVKAQQTSTRPSGDFETENQETDTGMEFELPEPKSHQAANRNVGSESRVESQGTKTSMQSEYPNSKVQRTSSQNITQKTGADFQRTDTDVQINVSKFQTRKASSQTFRPKSAAEEQTLRPSVDPQQALATVMAQLSDELAELKEEHNQVTSEYMALDPAMKRRMRKEMKSEMERLLLAIERKADQVYLLQDVQEGILPYEPSQ